MHHALINAYEEHTLCNQQDNADCDKMCVVLLHLLGKKAKRYELRDHSAYEYVPDYLPAHDALTLEGGSVIVDYVVLANNVHGKEQDTGQESNVWY